MCLSLSSIVKSNQTLLPDLATHHPGQDKVLITKDGPKMGITV